MKLRIHENSLRIRVNRPDLDALRRDGCIEHRLVIALGSALVYRLELCEEQSLSARLDGSCVTIRLPRAMAEEWYDDSAVSVSGVQPGDSRSPLNLLIEKDFACLVPRSGEDQSTYFSNPAKAQE